MNKYFNIPAPQKEDKKKTKKIPPASQKERIYSVEKKKESQNTCSDNEQSMSSVYIGTVIEMTGMEGLQRAMKEQNSSWLELERYKERWFKWNPNYIDVDIDNYSVASSIPSDEEEEALNDMNNVLDALDTVNTQSIFMNPLDISGTEAYKKATKKLDDMLNSITDKTTIAEPPDDNKEEPHYINDYIKSTTGVTTNAPGSHDDDDWSIASSYIDRMIEIQGLEELQLEIKECFRTKRPYQSEIERLTKRGIKWVNDELNTAPGQLKVDEEKIGSEERTQSTTTTSLENYIQ